MSQFPPFDIPEEVRTELRTLASEADSLHTRLSSSLPVRVLVEFLRFTGWRRDEARLLTWAAVDRDHAVMRLEGARTKNGKPRIFAFGDAPPLKALLEARWAVRDGLYVFHRDGQAIGRGAVRVGWRRACLRTGLAVKDPVTKKVKLLRIVHDLRRTAARDFRRAGVSEGEVMKLCGWRTRDMFDRYNIIDEADLAAAVAKRFNGGVKAESKGTPAVPQSLNSSARIT
jgi:integrase